MGVDGLSMRPRARRMSGMASAEILARRLAAFKAKGNGKRRMKPMAKPKPHRKWKTRVAMGTPVDFGNLSLYVPEVVPEPVAREPYVRPADFVTMAEVRKEVEVVRETVQDKLIMDFIATLPAEVTVGRVQALAKRAKEKVQAEIRKARDQFNMQAANYVELHMESARGALANKDFGTAAKSAQWALENIGEGEVRVIDRPEKDAGSKGTNIMIGIKLGGVPEMKALTSGSDE